MKSLTALLPVLLCLSCSLLGGRASDRDAVLATLDSWKGGWATADADRAVQDYAEDVDWTNAFGDRFQGRAALRDGLAAIFELDFVMAGTSSEEVFADVTFPAPDVALIRSQLVRRGQRQSDGLPMADRRIHHLRVLQRREGRWQIISHLISQAREKR